MTYMLRSGCRSKFVLAVHRFGGEIDEKFKNNLILRALSRVIHLFGRYLSVVFSKIMIKERARIGKNLWFSPKGNIILGVSSIGDNCLIHQNVTLGMGLGLSGFGLSPTVGNNVWVGPNTIIYGDILIGDGVTILGDTVLSKSIPSRCVVGGNPAKLIRKNFDNKRLLSQSECDISADSLSEWEIK